MQKKKLSDPYALFLISVAMYYSTDQKSKPPFCAGCFIQIHSKVSEKKMLEKFLMMMITDIYNDDGHQMMATAHMVTCYGM